MTAVTAPLVELLKMLYSGFFVMLFYTCFILVNITPEYFAILA